MHAGDIDDAICDGSRVVEVCSPRTQRRGGGENRKRTDTEQGTVIPDKSPPIPAVVGRFKIYSGNHLWIIEGGVRVAREVECPGTIWIRPKTKELRGHRIDPA